MAGTVKKLQFSEGTDVGAPVDLSLQTSTTVISDFVDDAAYVLAEGAAADGSVYLNSTSKKFRYYLSAWQNAVPESDPTDPTKVFLVDSSGNSTGVSSTLDFNNTANRVYTFPNYNGTMATLAGSEQLSNKELVSAVFSGSFDVAAAGNITIAGSIGANNLTLGGASSTVVIPGNLTVQGTTTAINTTNLEVEDFNITVNKGGNDVSAEGAGLTVERVSTYGSLIFDSSLASKWKLGLLGSEIQIADVSSSQTFTNKELTSPVISGAIHRGTLLLQNTSGAQPVLALSEDPDNGTNVVNIRAPATLGADYTLTMPSDDGASGQVLTTDGSGNLSWSSVSTFSGSSTDNAIARFDGVSGALQNSGLVIDDSNNLTGIVDLTTSGKFALGPAAGLGTSGAAYNTAYGSTAFGLTSSLTFANLASLTTFEITPGFFRDGAGSIKAIATQTGYTQLRLDRTGSAAADVFSISANYQDAQTANSAIVSTNTRQILAITAEGTMTVNPTVSSVVSSGKANVFHGGISAGGTGTGDFERMMIVNANAYRAASASNYRTRATGLSGCSIEISARNDNSFSVLDIYANQTGDGATTNGDAIAFATGLGAWNFNISVSSVPSSGVANVFHGGINAGGTGTSDGNRTLFLNANAYFSSYASNLRARQTGLGGIFIEAAARNDNTFSALHFWANQTGDGATTNADLAGFMTQNGLWSFGIAANQDQLHLFHGAFTATYKSIAAGGPGLCTFYGMNSTATDFMVQIRSDVGGTNVLKWRVEADGDTISATGSYTSDSRAKKLIRAIPYGLSHLLQLNPIGFRWIHEDDEEVESFSAATAQEIEAVMPELVRDDGIDDGQGGTFKAVYDRELMAVMVNAIKELAARVAQLEAQLA